MAETIFMIHGMWGGAWYWENYKNFLEARGYSCIATTLRYHDIAPGQAPDPRLGPTSLLDYAEDLEKEIRGLDKDLIIMGHSMGGLLAQMLGARGLGKALVLLTPASPAGITALKPSVIRTFFRIMTKWGYWRKPMRLTYDEAVYSMLSLMSQEVAKTMYEKLGWESGRAAFEIGYWLLDGRKATAVDESKVTQPVLVVGGGQDRITPVSVSRAVAAKYKAVSTFKEFPNHAHWVVGEPGWEEIASFVADWMEKL